MAHPRFELGTPWLKVKCSTGWANEPCIIHLYLFSNFKPSVSLGSKFYFQLVAHPRFELGTPWLKVKCSTGWANEPYLLYFIFGWGGRFRTLECGSQSPMPYHLATPQCRVTKLLWYSPLCNFNGWGGWIWTNECESQSLVPYHLATPQCIRVLNLAGVAGFEPTRERVKVSCLTAWLHPNIKF